MPSHILSSPALAVECRTESENMPVTFSSPNEVTVVKFPRPPCPAKVLFCPKPSTSSQCLPCETFTTISRRQSRCHHLPTKRLYLLQRTRQRCLARNSDGSPLLSAVLPSSRSTTPIPQTPMMLTVPQLVASLTLVHREQSDLRSKGRSLNSSNCSSEKDAHFTRDPLVRKSMV